MMNDLFIKAGQVVDQFSKLPVLEQIAYVIKALFDVFILLLKGAVIIAVIGALTVVLLMIREWAYELKERRKKK